MKIIKIIIITNALETNDHKAYGNGVALVGIPQMINSSVSSNPNNFNLKKKKNINNNTKSTNEYWTNYPKNLNVL